MTVGVRTNESAMIALQNLNNTNRRLETVQQRISTGLEVTQAKDNASIYAIAQGQRADMSSYESVTSSLNRATSIADVANAAGQNVSDILNMMREKVVSAMDTSLSSLSRQALNNDFQALIRQIQNTVENAQFDGANIINGTITAGIAFLANADATLTITLSARNLSFGGGNITFSAATSLVSISTIGSVLSALDNSIDNVNLSLGALGSQTRQIEGHNIFVSKLSDALAQGIGNLVDADLARESAKLQALQVQQQLGTQSLSIANQSPQILLSLFRQ
jgi:flagellin